MDLSLRTSSPLTWTAPTLLQNPITPSTQVLYTALDSTTKAASNFFREHKGTENLNDRQKYTVILQFLKVHTILEIKIHLVFT